MMTTVMEKTNYLTTDSGYPFPNGAPREKVFEDARMTLYRYQTDHPNPCPVPLLTVYALVNRTYVMDLTPQKSFVRSLLEKGFVIYMVDWKNPEAEFINPKLEDYINKSIHRSVNWIKREHQLDSINLLGICQGGTFSTIYTALHPENIRNLITMVTPVDFHAGGNIFSHFAKKWETEKVEQNKKYLSADFMNIGFLNLKPFELLISKYLGSGKMMKKEENKELFWRMEKWIFDSPAQAVATWAKFIRECYKHNNLIHGKMEVGGTYVDLKSIKCPVLNLTAEKDHLVPAEASLAMKDAISSEDYSHHSFRTGHIGVFVSSITKKQIAPVIDEWLYPRSK